ncbi:MAG: glucokinase [Alphaproteobacteria bacterium]|nr:glucokinase [Alphaproteobacteria bacterium]
MALVVGDIGGTNLRFAVVAPADGSLQHRVAWPGDRFPDAAAALSAFCAEAGVTPEAAALAVAGPVVDDWIELTNRPWAFSRQRLAQDFRLSRLVLLNDFEALAEALPHLTAADSLAIGPGHPVAQRRLAVIGPGTGLGVAAAVETGSGWVALPGEGGHTTFAATTDAEEQVRRFWADRWQERITNEHLLSGPGLARIHEALTAQQLPPEMVSAAAAAGDLAAAASLELWFSALGRYAGDVGLLTLATGGVYLAGGVLPRLVPQLLASGFRRQFEDRGREAQWLGAVPTALITAEDVALRGCAARLTSGHR